MKIEAVPFARKVLEYAEQEHEDFKFDMTYWWSPMFKDSWGNTKIGSLANYKVCGTAACLAGTAVYLDSETHVSGGGYAYQNDVIMHDEDIQERGTELLGLSREEADCLFVRSNSDALAWLRTMIEKAEERESR